MVLKRPDKETELRDILLSDKVTIIWKDPFDEYPNLARVLDQMAEKGLHLYYPRLRTVFKDEGTKWREKWEHHIHIWMKKARILDTFSYILDNGVFSVKHLEDFGISLGDYKLAQILEKICKAFQAQKELVELQNWLLLNAKINNSPMFVQFIEDSLECWKRAKGDEIQSPLFEVAPKGTMEQLSEVEHVLEFLENTNPMGKMDGLPVHNSEVLEYTRLWLRSIRGLPTDVKNLWSVRDVRKIYGWTGMSKKPRCAEESRANPAVARA